MMFFSSNDCLKNHETNSIFGEKSKYVNSKEYYTLSKQFSLTSPMALALYENDVTNPCRLFTGIR
jgi:hypothetical protein